MDVLRTPDSRFENLHGYPFAPHYVDVAAGLSLRAQPCSTTLFPELLMSGEPEW
jgi:haloalkane dehalogenase